MGHPDFGLVRFWGEVGGEDAVCAVDGAPDMPDLSCRVLSGEVGGGDRDGGDCGGFGAEDTGAEGYVGPLVLGEEGHFFGSPAAFGTDGQG